MSIHYDVNVFDICMIIIIGCGTNRDVRCNNIIISVQYMLFENMFWQELLFEYIEYSVEFQYKYSQNLHIIILIIGGVLNLSFHIALLFGG